MSGLSHHDVTLMLVAVAILLAGARLLGEIARRFHQPAVIGEILAGILLGETVLGRLFPGLFSQVFPAEGPVPVALHGLTTLAITMFLLVAGMEVDLSAAWRRGKASLMVALAGTSLPFVLGFVPAVIFPSWFGSEEGTSRYVFALFLATAMSITALPVIARILLDLNLFRSDLGVTVISAAIINDLTGWIIFALVLALLGTGAGAGLHVGMTILLTVAFAVFMLTVGRWLLNRTLPWVQAHASWPGGVLGFALTLAIFCAAFTEWIGVHAIFGAFLFGVALGDSRHLHERTRATIDQFVSFIFAPLFFASIGLRVDFLREFSPLLVLVVLVVATVGKVGGCSLAARWAGFTPRESRAIGYGMNARGAMEIILGLLALQAGLIGERLFVALVIMALVTSIGAGALMQVSLGRRKVVRFIDHVSTRTFVPALQSRERRAVIEELSAVAAAAAGLDGGEVARAVLQREQLITSALGKGIAIPHARIPGLRQPVIAAGLCADGVDFQAPDGLPVTTVLLILSPREDDRVQIDILGSIARTFQNERTIRHVMTARSLTELRAALNIANE